MILTEEQKFRQWLNKTYGVQDYEAYRNTQTEEIAIQYAALCLEELQKEQRERTIDMMTIFNMSASFLSVEEAKTEYPKLFAAKREEAEKFYNRAS